MVGHRGDQLGGLVGVTGVEDHAAATERAELGQVLERHLGGAVLADREPAWEPLMHSLAFEITAMRTKS